MEEERANANSELRYLALELTKLAQKSKKPFAAVASEYVDNVFELEELLRSNAGMAAAKSAKRSAPTGTAQRQKKDRD